MTPNQQPDATQAGTGPAVTEPVTRGNDVPTTQTQYASTQAQAQPAAAQEPGVQQQGFREQGIQEQGMQGQGMQEQGIQEQGIWDATKADEFRHRWHDVQTHFVEDPRGSVAEARQLVDEAVQSLAESVHDREEQLEHAGARSSDSTEGMRDTVLQYHHLLDRLLAV